MIRQEMIKRHRKDKDRQIAYAETYGRREFVDFKIDPDIEKRFRLMPQYRSDHQAYDRDKYQTGEADHE